jgi:putative heme degradation protein
MNVAHVKDPSDSRQNVRKAASDALAIMAKTSEVTRVHMFPALLHHLEHPSPQALSLIAQGTPDHV